MESVRLVSLFHIWKSRYELCKTCYIRQLFMSAKDSNLVSKLENPENGPDVGPKSNTIDRTRRISRTQDEFTEQMKLKPIQPDNPRFLRVAIIGDPNSGKSTLANKLTNWRACSVSSKVHTTRRNTRAVFNIDDTQIEFTDTPGTINFDQSVKHHLESSLVHDPLKSSNQADLLLVLVDAGNMHSRLHLSNEIKGILHKHSAKQSILVLNKMDVVKDKTKLLEVGRSLCNGLVNRQPFGTKEKLFLPNNLKEKLFKQMDSGAVQQEKKTLHKGWSKFSKLFMVSALHNEGVSSLLSFLLDVAPSRPWKYHPSVVVGDGPQELTKRVVREKLLDNLKEEMGYALAFHITYWEIDESDVLKISVVIKCPKKNLVKIIIGPGGKIISEISRSAEQELCNVFHCQVRLHLVVKYVPPPEKIK